MKANFTTTVAGASVFLATIGLVSKGIGFIREIVFAGYFGLGKDYDLYLVGAVLPLTIGIIIYYIGQNFFIPLLHKESTNSVDTKEKIIRFYFWIFTFIGIVIALILLFFSNKFVELYLGESSIDTLNKASNIFNIILITIPFSAAISILTAVLQSNFNFTSPGISRLFLNISIILFVIILTARLEIYVIPIGYVVGTVLQFFYLLRKSRIKIFGKLIEKSALTSIFVPSLLFTIIIESISQLYLLSDRYFMENVDAGGIAALNYAQTLYLLPISIVTLALSTAILPKLSKLFVKGSSKELEQTFNDGISINLFVFIPISFIFFFYGDQIIQLIFQRGKFSGSDSIMTYNVLKYLALSFIFYSTYSLSNKLMYSVNLVKALLYLTIIGIFAKVIFNFILVETMKQDGLATSTSLSYFIFFAGSFLIIRSKKIINKNIFISELIFQVSNGIFSLFVANSFANILSQDKSIIVYFYIIFFTSIFVFNQIIIKTRSVDLIWSLAKRFNISS